MLYPKIACDKPNKTYSHAITMLLLDKASTTVFYIQGTGGDLLLY